VNLENYAVRIYLPNIVRIVQPRTIKIGSACSARGSIRNKFDLLGMKILGGRNEFEDIGDDGNVPVASIWTLQK
jgi:hypothetical protein